MEINTITPHNRPSDPLLEFLIKVKESLEKKGEEHPDFPITLNVGGMLITGDLISRNAYMKDFLYGPIVKAIRKAEEDDELLKQQTEEIRKEVKEKPYDFIHLKNAKFFVPGQPPIPTEQESTLWRGRLSCVDGFTMGSLALAKIES